MLAGLALSVGLLYVPGLGGPFLLDDFTNLVRLEYLDGTINGVLLAIFNNTGELLNRPISFASFLLHAGAWPAEPFGFKLVNLLLHLITGVVFYVFLKQLPKARDLNPSVLVFAGVALWLASPLQVSTVLYVVQRMTILSTLFGMLFLLVYLRGRLSEDAKYLHAVLATFFLAASFLSKENGMVFVLLALMLEVYLRGIERPQTKNSLLFVLVSVLAALFILAFVYKAFSVLGSYERRSFSLIERLLVEGRILADYIGLSLIPVVSYMSLYHDSYEWNIQDKLLLGGFFWVLHISIIVLSIKYRKKHSLVFLGVTWFYCAHIIESTILPIELMFEHRNYAPSAGIYIVIAYLVALLYKRLDSSGLPLTKLILVLPFLVFSIFLVYRSAIWGNSYAMFSKWAFYKPDSKRAQFNFVIELERNGMLDYANTNSREMYEKFDMLGVYLYNWRTGCFLSEEALMNREFIRPEKVKSMTHSSEVSFELGVVTRLWAEGKCLPNGYQQSDIDAFLESVQEMKTLAYTPKYKAKVIETIGKYYELVKRYDKSVKYKLDLYNIQPTVDTALRNVEFALQFNMLEYAEEFIQKAKEQNSKVSVFASDRSNLIEILEGELDRRKELMKEGADDQD